MPADSGPRAVTGLPQQLCYVLIVLGIFAAIVLGTH
jgi:hypothetical protein